MKKRALSLILTITLMLSLCISLVPESLASGEMVVLHSGTIGPEDNRISWQVEIPREEYEAILSNNGKLTITAGTSAVIPSYSRGGAPWHDFNTHSAIITDIVLDGITEIGANAFSDFGNLRKVELTARTNLRSIGDSAFLNCTNLEGFYRQNAGSNHAVLDNLTHIYNNAFYNCSNLRQLLLTGSIYVIGSNVFFGCSNLSRLWANGYSPTPRPVANPPAGARTLGYGVDSSGVLMEINTSGHIRVIKAPVTMPETSYSGMVEQTGIIWADAGSDNIVSIESEAFAHIRNLETIAIPASVSVVGYRAFAYSTELEFAVFLGNRPTFLVDGGAEVFAGLKNPDSFTIIFFPQAIGWTTPLWNGYNAKVSDTIISLNRSTIVMAVNTTAELYATVTPTNTARQAVLWTSEDPSIATVAGTRENGNIGVIHGLSVGTTRIIAADRDGLALPQSCTVIVVPSLIPMTGLTLDKTSLTLIAGTNDPPNFPDSTAVLNAIVYPSNAVPFPELVWTSSNSNVAYVDYMIDDSSTPTSLRHGRIVPVSPGTATITVRATTPDGNTRWASAVVTVLADPATPTSFIPVSSVTPISTTAVMGEILDLNHVFSVQPINATHNNPAKIEWWHLSGLPGVPTGAQLPSSIITIPPLAGSIHLEVRIQNGIADTQWQHPINVHFAQQVVINIGSFVPVTDIIDGPSSAYVGVPLPLTATVVPEGATYTDIEWTIEDPGNTGAYIDPITGMLITQRPGSLRVRATVINGAAVTMDGNFVAQGDIYRIFTINVSVYTPNPLYLMPDLGGSINGDSELQMAGGEVVQLTAVAAEGFAFAGWYSSDGGIFADATKPTTEFTMPFHTTTIIAFFIHEGGITPPALTGYFERGSTYVKNSGVTFTHTTQKTLDRFSHVMLNGTRLVRHQHYTTGSSRDFTEITLANGYLDRLNAGIYTMEVHFTDLAYFTMQFTVVAAQQVPFQAPSQFDDVYSSNWYNAHVTYVNDRSWMTPDDSEPWLFRPNDLVTQGEVVQALYRMAGRPSVIDLQGNPLYGLSAAHEWARQTGMAPLGGTFYLTRTITRQDVALLVNRMVGGMGMRYPVTRSAPNFMDERQIAQAARIAVVNLYRAEIMNARVGNTFDPQGSMTRAEYAAVLHRFAIVMGV